MIACEEGATIRVTSFGAEDPNAFCRDFRLTEAQARTFFAKAKPVTAEAIHREYTWLPCYVDGTIQRKGESALKWRIRPIGIGQVFHEGGAEEWLGCPNCDQLFPSK
jgi:hypothetical protein